MSADRRVAKLAREGVHGLLTTRTLALVLREQHNIRVTKERLRTLHRAGFGYDDKRPYVYPPVDELLANLTEGNGATILERRTLRGWTRVKREGWAAETKACKPCRRQPVRSASRARFGEHVQVRLADGVIQARCACTHPLGELDALFVPPADLGQIARLDNKEPEQLALPA